jgi:hypothetical protein
MAQRLFAEYGIEPAAWSRPPKRRFDLAKSA